MTSLIAGVTKVKVRTMRGKEYPWSWHSFGVFMGYVCGDNMIAVKVGGATLFFSINNIEHIYVEEQ